MQPTVAIVDVTRRAGCGEFRIGAQMSELRANILELLTQEAGHIREVPVARIYERLPQQFLSDRAAIAEAFSDLLSFGLIELNPRGIILSRIVPRPDPAFSTMSSQT